VKTKKLRQYVLVKLTEEYREDLKNIGGYRDMLDELHFVYLGEIPNMLGHCVVVGWSGKVYPGYHTWNFVELTDEEM